MEDAAPTLTFAPIIDFLSAGHRQVIRDKINAHTGLHTDEAAIAACAADQALLHNAERKLNRVLLLELHAAKLSGDLHATYAADQFIEFLQLATQPGCVEQLDRRYPVLRSRLDRCLRQQGEAIVQLLDRLVADRTDLAALTGSALGRLRSLELEQGDVHNGGCSVARIRFAGAEVMYKPRSLAVDKVLDEFLASLLGNDPYRICVPTVLDRGDYGWSRFVDHRHCANDDELSVFYRNIGHWLAVMRLLGGTDVHSENLIASGPVPYVVDVESLFVLDPDLPSSGMGEAVDLAQSLIRSSVLRTGLVPFRAPVLGLNGVDISAIGALEGEQPKIRIPEIVDHGTSDAHVGMVSVEMQAAKNHPCPDPEIAKFWDCIVAGFQDLTSVLLQFHCDSQLRPMLNNFEGCRIRRIRRPTQAYVEIMRMLWHPASLHDQDAAIKRAMDLLELNSAVVPMAPAESHVIAAEVEDMLYGDVPVFCNALRSRQLDAVFEAWLTMRPELEELTIRGALVTAHLNKRLNDDRRSIYDLTPRNPCASNLDQRRRAMAAQTLRQLLHLSVRGRDGTMTWISPILGRSGWSMRTLQPNLYIGLGGIAVALAGYLHETNAGRADEVHGVGEALHGVLRVLATAKEIEHPDAVGAFVGLGSQIMTTLFLDAVLPAQGHLETAVTYAAELERRDLGELQLFDIMEGISGTIVPLLQLAQVTGDARWFALAARAGQRLEQAAIVDDRGARWPTSIFTEPLGGFAHGSTGTGWALARLGMSQAGDDAERLRWSRLAEKALDFEESLYQADALNWIDLRKPESRDFANTWCHGSVGIGLAACDLYARTGGRRHLDTLHRAVDAADRGGWGYSHTLCHGDLSYWELRKRAKDIDPALVSCETLPGMAIILSSIEEHGIVGGLARDAFTPGLMSGISGSIHQLNRMHPDCMLPSPLLLECRLGEYQRTQESGQRKRARAA